ncbi:FadR/GntR family transcriptional regulator [Galactobacter valiniphilus]|uniref:FadR/GntR family transcriptional regulator n=1 Tax=Galactobacter valiniphilus TaxID=2676122 RepID=UPI001313F7D8|nr:FCD domain-containing protein [Galactobacter valiniphilus]
MRTTGAEPHPAAAAEEAQQAGNAHVIADRIANSISLGLLAVGERLPPEIELAQQFGVAVATLRKGLAVLRERGIVVTHRGRSGGSFVVKAPFPSDAESENRLRSLSVVELRDLRDHSISVGSTTARLAAERAWDGALARLRELATSVTTAPTAATAASADSRFHIEVAVLAQSRRLMNAELELQSELTPLLWAQSLFGGGGARSIQEQHLRIVDAIASGDGDAAARAMAEHISADAHCVIDAKLSLEVTSS